MPDKLIGYETFLPAITASVFGKRKNDDQVSESEFKQIVAITFRDAVIQVMKDTLLYRVEVPIDLYQDVKRYDIIPPEGFRVEDVVELKEHKTTIPPNSYDLKNIRLLCCPGKDVQSAFFVEVALSAKRVGGVCEFDEDFVDAYYDVILNQMYVRLSAMVGRTWRSLGSVERHRRNYLSLLNSAKRQALSNGRALKIKVRRLSSHG